MDAGKQLKHDIISLLNQNKISLAEAGQALNVSERTILRHLKNFKAKGPAFVLHGNAGRTPINKTSENLIEKSKNLMKEKYFDFNMTHALEKFSCDEGIKINRETFREVCHSIGMVKKSHRRKSKTRKVRDRIPQEGVMLQMDGSPHRWFGGIVSCLIGAIDDASSEVHGGEFFDSETTLGCLKVLKSIILKKGGFSILYTDRAGIFGGPKRVNFSQVKRALRELGIVIIFANSAEAKGRIERLWETLQDRLVAEMRLRNINTFESANHFLQNEHLPNDHNKKFKVLPRNLEPAWKPLPAGIDLDQIFCLKEHRTVNKDHTYSWDNALYKITSDFKYSIQNQKIEIRTYLDESRKVFFADREIGVERHHVQPKISLVESTVIVEDEKDTLTVRKDSHVFYLNKYYSVDPIYVDKSVTVRERESFLIIYHRKQMIENHKKITGPHVLASTKPEHLGPWQESLKPSSVYRRAASAIGPNCDRVIFAILQRGQGIIDNKNIWAIINLKKDYLRASVEEACHFAYETSSCNYSGVASVLRLRYRKKITS